MSLNIKLNNIKLNSNIKNKLNIKLNPNSNKLNTNSIKNKLNTKLKTNSNIKKNSNIKINTNSNIKKKLNKAKSNYANNPGDPKEVHRFYDRIIRLATNSSNTLFPRKEPKENWSKYKTEEEYDNSLQNAVEFSNKFTEEQKKSINVIIFNKTNADGVMSGYIPWKYVTDGGTNQQFVKILSTNSNKEKFGVAKGILALENFITGKNVILVDVAINIESLEYIKNKANFFVSIDNHHLDGSSELPYVYITDYGPKQLSAHAACAAVWKFFYPTEKVSYVIQSIDSGDSKLYLKYLPDPGPINTAFAVNFVKNQSQKEYSSNPITLFKQIHEFLSDGTQIQALNFLAVLGQIMDRFGENMKLEIAPKAYPATFKTPDKSYKVYVLNYAQPGMQKRLGKYIASQHPDSDFSVLWFYNHRDQSIDFTLSTSHKPGEQVDMFKIAKSMGSSGGAFKDSAHIIYKGDIGDLNKIIITQPFSR